MKNLLTFDMDFLVSRKEKNENKRKNEKKKKKTFHFSCLRIEHFLSFKCFL